MRKLISFVLILLLCVPLVACGSMTGNKSVDKYSENRVNAANTKSTEDVVRTITNLTEPLVINTTGEVVLTLKNLNASMKGNAIRIDDAKSVTIILEGENFIESTGSLTEPEPTTIISRADITIKGEGSLTINSYGNCIRSLDNITVEAGTLSLTANGDTCLVATNTIALTGGAVICYAEECLEATQIEISDGIHTLQAFDNAINATDDFIANGTPSIAINGGHTIVMMNSGDEAITSDGDLIINEGLIEVYATQAFDWDGKLEFNGGTVAINGVKVETITNRDNEDLPTKPFNKPNKDEVRPVKPLDPSTSQRRPVYENVD